MNVFEAAKQVEGLADGQLAQLMQAPNPEVPGYLVLGEMEKRRRMRESTAPQSGQGQGSMAQEAIAREQERQAMTMPSYARGGPIEPEGRQAPDFGVFFGNANRAPSSAPSGATAAGIGALSTSPQSPQTAAPVDIPIIQKEQERPRFFVPQKAFAAGGAVGGLMPLSRDPVTGKVRFGE